MKNKRSALSYSLKLLSYRGRSEGELINRLSVKGYPDTEIDSTIRYLKETGLIDDKRLALNFAGYALETKGLGAMGVRDFLLSKGIPADVAQEACCGIDEEENALRLVRKKVKGCRDERMKRRVYNFLQRRGYSFETIKRVLRKIYDEEVS